jgi:hypothetical protein
MARYPDPHSRLGCALADLSGGEVIESRQTPWASATFSGARHHFVLLVPGKAEPAGLARLDQREFDLPGHLVADILLSERVDEAEASRIAIEALTVEDI